MGGRALALGNEDEVLTSYNLAPTNSGPPKSMSFMKERGSFSG
jgi:hypothetical protein